MEKVSIDKAREELNLWLDYKKVSEKRRADKAIAADSIVEAIVSGDLSLQPDSMKFVYLLKFPVKSDSGELVFDKLEFMPRMRAADLTPHMKGVKADDVHGRVRATIAALTRQSKELIAKMDTEDMELAESIALFFF